MEHDHEKLPFLKNLYNKRVDILEKVKLGSSKLKTKFNIITFTVLKTLSHEVLKYFVFLLEQVTETWEI